MNAIYILTSSLLFAVAPAENWGADSPPALPPAGVRPALPSILGKNGDEPQPTPAPRTTAELQEEIRQLRQRVAVLERQVWAFQGPQSGESRSPATGRLVLDNRTLNTHSVSVNGLLFSVAPGRTEMDIPIGTANVYLPYHESPKQWGLDRWRWNGRNYEMLIVIGRQ
jgi:hypothetical protein